MQSAIRAKLMNVFGGDFVQLKLPCLPSSALYEAYDEGMKDLRTNLNVIFFLFFILDVILVHHNYNWDRHSDTVYT
jgi:hypothetical protein